MENSNVCKVFEVFGDRRSETINCEANDVGDRASCKEIECRRALRYMGNSLRDSLIENVTRNSEGAIHGLHVQNCKGLCSKSSEKKMDLPKVLAQNYVESFMNVSKFILS